MIWAKYGPIVCYLDFSWWGGGWGDEVMLVDYSYVVLPQPGKSTLPAVQVFSESQTCVLVERKVLTAL
jgi:hypothetical protein